MVRVTTILQKEIFLIILHDRTYVIYEAKSLHHYPEVHYTLTNTLRRFRQSEH